MEVLCIALALGAIGTSVGISIWVDHQDPETLERMGIKK